MDHRLHRALDHDLATHELTPELAAELDDARALFDGVVRSIPERPIPDLGAAVLRRIGRAERAAAPLRLASGPPRRPRGVVGWLWAPHRMTVAIRPAYAMAAAAALAVAIGVGGTYVGRGRDAAPAVAAARAEVLVHFRLDAPQARTVMLAGDFSNWSPTFAMTRSADGVWTIVVPLAPGVHEYAFIVDGSKWVPDPVAPPTPDGFGGMNSRVAVLGPDKRT